MKTKDFYYELPEELIAQHPVTPRDSSRLMVVDRKTGFIEEKIFRDILEELNKGDVLVLNDTKVRPARLFVHREGKEESIEVLLLKPMANGAWDCLVKPGRKMKVGTRIEAGDLISGKVESITEEGNRIIRFSSKMEFEKALEVLGEMPLPPYITEKLEDKNRYQTVYSKYLGSAAAPTAGLHFTEDLLERIRSKGVKIVFVTLHVGLGTFRPVKVEEITEHVMHEEYCIIEEETAKIINETKADGGRIIAVGTTSTRTLESMTGEDGILRSGSMWTDIFIYPGYSFKMVDALITNFHLPESTLLMLVSALSSRELMLKAYKQAVEHKFRFFSFGDCMFIK